MSAYEIPLLLLLLLAHIVGDFVLQKSSWIDERYEKRLYSRRLYLHAAIHTILPLAVLMLLLGPGWGMVGYAAVIGTTHFAFDLAKSYTEPGRLRWFMIDQLLHLLVIGAVWLSVSRQWFLLDQAALLATQVDLLLVLLGYIVVIGPFSIVIGLVCQAWTAEIDDSGTLANAGRRIGQLERFLILTFILVEQFAAIGFLLAAKSILRFGDTKEPNHRKINEYILVGTMTSFSLTIAFGLFLKLLIRAL